MRYSELNGNWEERGVIGTRIEIAKGKICVLWRNSPVLETSFTVKKDSEKLILKLKDNSLRYKGDSKEYATVKEISYEGGKLTFVEVFPITGESSEVLEKTENSRYGNYKIVDDRILPLLNGKWKSDDGFSEFTFSRGKLTLRGQTIKIHALQYNSSFDSGEYKIVDDDPSKNDRIFDFINMKFSGGELTAVIPVCDAPSIVVVFHRV